MAREVATTGTHLQAVVGVGGEDGCARPTVQRILPVVLFIVLAGIWACMGVPPSPGI